jgi:hypothetical protein
MARGVERGMLWLVLNTSDIRHVATCYTKQLSSAVYFLIFPETSSKLTS